MSNFITPNYNYSSEIIQANEDGFNEAVNSHNQMSGLDRNGQPPARLAGYQQASTTHRDPSTVNGQDLLLLDTGFNDGYDAASVDHTNPSATGSDPKGRIYGYKAGYDAGHSAGIPVGVGTCGRGYISMAADQTLPLNVYTRVNTNNTVACFSGMSRTSNVLRADMAGYYDVGAGVNISVVDSGNGNTHGYLYIRIYKNGGAIAYSRCDVVAYSDDITDLTVSATNVYMTAGDYFSIYVKPVFDAVRISTVTARAYSSSYNWQGSFLIAHRRT